MGKVKWKTATEIKAERQKADEKVKQKDRFKGKQTISRQEADELLMQIAKDLGYLQ